MTEKCILEIYVACHLHLKSRGCFSDTKTFFLSVLADNIKYFAGELAKNRLAEIHNWILANETLQFQNFTHDYD